MDEDRLDLEASGAFTIVDPRPARLPPLVLESWCRGLWSKGLGFRGIRNWCRVEVSERVGVGFKGFEVWC